MSIRDTAAVAALCLLGLSAPSFAAKEARLVAGTLTCKGYGTVGLIVGSKEKLSCSFDAAGRTPPQSYNASITKLGLDIGIKGDSIMVWTVLASTDRLPAGALKGEYGGVSAEAAVGIGAGANALIGGSNRSVVLQPISVEGQTGLNIAVGVAELKLWVN